ncbi:MAG: Mrp/NBP35 family ATP-binding protein [Thaumarchaeota archaeon]|nr:Mrp/NBP35 family ATP-binding protein [Nitrososphaerota archaeon]
MVSSQDVLKALGAVADPELGKDIVSLNMVRDLKVEGDVVRFTLNLTTPACPLRSKMEGDARKAAESVRGVARVDMKVTAEVASTRQPQGLEALPGVKNVIAVASGKGGVGKSTVAVNLALALASSGARVGLLDADIYGPNVPLMMGIKDRPEVKDNIIMPPLSHGVKVASLGFFYKDETALIWRGPMVAGAVRQLITQVQWGDLDYLIIDLPPGTGDAGLTVAQTVPLGGVIIVSTPQQAALNIATKAIGMFKKLNVPILGIVENMSYFVCPHCGDKSFIFSNGGARKAAADLDLQFLGEIPLYPKIREQSDLGDPIVVSSPDSPEAAVFKEIAFKVAGMISIMAYNIAE